MRILEKASEIKKNIKKHHTIFITGHKNLDLDAIGSALGISEIAKKYHRQTFILVDDIHHELGVEKIIKEQDPRIFIKTEDIDSKKGKTNLLIITDTNKTNLLSHSEILDKFDDILVIDHHQTNEKTISNATLIIDLNASSTCEMIVELLQHYKIPISSNLATIILSGITLDTNNFVLKTDTETFKAAYYLSICGADTKKVQYYLKQDIKDYIIRQKVITNAQIIDGKYAVTTGEEDVSYRREDLARVATTLLQFNQIEASFVIGKNQDGEIGVSARSEGNINVGKIVESLGGGGDNHDAAAQLKDTTIKEIKDKVLKLISKGD